MLRSAYFTGHAFEALESPFLSETIVSRSPGTETESQEPEVEPEADQAEASAEASEEMTSEAEAWPPAEQEATDAFETEAEAAPLEEALDFIERPENEIRTELEGESAFEAATDGFAPRETAAEDSKEESFGDGAGEWEAIGHEHAAVDEAFVAAAEADLEHTVELEDEILGGTDERKPVTDVLAVPTRWICALDIWEANPLFGTTTSQPQLKIKARGTGILIGPRHVLTADHVVAGFTAASGGKIKKITVSAARSGDNSSHPFGAANVTKVHRSQSYPGQAIPQPDGSTVRAHDRDDYALLVLDRDLGGATNARLKGQLGFWGENPSVAVIKVLGDAALHGKDARVTGYPGDACGSALIKRSSTPLDKLIANCVARRPDEWASRQWWAVGTMDARNHRRLLYHTADTHEGQSGSPIYFAISKVCHLAAVHSGNDNSRRNKGERVTARMLKEIADWINLDTSVATATVQNDTLTVRRAAPAKASEMEESDGREI